MSYAEWKSDQNWLNGSQKQLVIFSRNLVLTSRKIIEGSKKACFWPKTPLFLTCGGTPWWVLMIFNKKWPPQKISCPKIEYWLINLNLTLKWSRATELSPADMLWQEERVTHAGVYYYLLSPASQLPTIVLITGNSLGQSWCQLQLLLASFFVEINFTLNCYICIYCHVFNGCRCRMGVLKFNNSSYFTSIKCRELDGLKVWKYPNLSRPNPESIPDGTAQYRTTVW